MAKKDRLKRALKYFRHPSEASASEPASDPSGTVFIPRLNEPTDTVNEASLTSRPQNAPVKDLWGLALEELSEENKEAMSHIPSDSKLEVLQHLRTAAVKKQAECESNCWKFEINGRQIILRDVVGKIIAWIDKFKQIGDIVVSFDPVHAALPWAGIRFLLEVRLMI